MRNGEEINRDILKQFDASLEMPESLSKNSMVKMLREKSVKQEKKTRVKILPKVMSAAAMLVIIAVAAVSIGLHSEFVEVEEPVNSEADVTVTQVKTESVTESAAQEETKEEKSQPVKSLKVAKSETDLQNHFLKLYAEDKLDNYIDEFVYKVGDVVLFNATSDSEAMDMAAPSLAVTQAATTQATVSSELKGNVPYGTTNVQVADVDEGDVIKNDGKYLYIVSSSYSAEDEVKSKLSIVNAETMSKVYEGFIKSKTENEYMYIRDIYVSGDILVSVCSYERMTYSVVYDITERHNPKEIRRVDQDGTYISSRMVDGILYTVTDYHVSGSSAEEIKENAIPQVNCDCIAIEKCYIIDEDSTGYIVLSAFDTKNKDSEVSSLSVLGDGYEIYSTSGTLYVYASDYEYDEDADYGVVHTDIYSFSLNGTDISHKSTGRIKGDCINQYSFDEYGGYLRVATTYYDYRTNLDVSNVYVLDESLKKVGEVTDLANDEQVKAVRFIGDTGYVVTFRNTDPLFILDLSNPAKPAVTGELKIPGYSTYLHPLKDGYLLGIGYDGDEENADMNTVKVSVFDVNDKTNPKETDTFVIKNASSLINSNPKAFFYYSERDMIAIPVTHYDNSGSVVKSLQTVTVKDGKISDHLGYIHYAGDSSKYYSYYGYYGEDLFRGTYIGNLLYTIDSTQVIEHNLVNGEKVRTCIIGSQEKEETDKKEESTENSLTTTPPVEFIITETTAVTVN